MNTNNQTLQAASIRTRGHKPPIPAKYSSSTGKYQIVPLFTKEMAFGAFT
jgi:hypothetical protein